MANELVGTIVLNVDGTEYDCASISVTETAGRKLVATMNSKGRANKSARTLASGKLQIDVYVDEDDARDWSKLEDATVTVNSLEGGYRETYSGVGVETVGKRFGGEEATQQLDCFYKDYVLE